MTAVNNIVPKQTEEIVWCPLPQYPECSPPDEETQQQEYRRLTNVPPNPSLTQFKNLKKETMSKGDRIALGAIATGIGFLIGGPFGASALLLMGCYGLDEIGKADNPQSQQSGSSDGDAGTNRTSRQTGASSGGMHTEMPPRDPCEGHLPTHVYSGPSETREVGICREQIRTCVDGVYQTTQDQILPRTEIPHNGLDDDCDGIVDRDSWVQVAAGLTHTCGVHNDGTVECWGSNDWDESTPPPGRTFTQVTAGMANFTCGIQTDETILCWGRDSGTGQTTPPSGTFRQIDAGVFTTCGIGTDNVLVRCWGAGGNQLLGYDFSSEGFLSQISVGSFHKCAVTISNVSMGWSDTVRADQFLPPIGTLLYQVSAGDFHTCGILTDNTIACWGVSSDNITAPSGTYLEVGAGWDFNCGLKTDRTIACAGGDTPPAGTFRHINVGAEHACGIKDDDTVECWGDNSSGQATPPSP